MQKGRGWWQGESRQVSWAPITPETEPWGENRTRTEAYGERRAGGSEAGLGGRRRSGEEACSGSGG